MSSVNGEAGFVLTWIVDRLARPDARPRGVALDPGAAVSRLGIDADVGRSSSRACRASRSRAGCGRGRRAEASAPVRGRDASQPCQARGRRGLEDVAAGPVALIGHGSPPVRGTEALGSIGSVHPIESREQEAELVGQRERPPPRRPAEPQRRQVATTTSAYSSRGGGPM